VRPRCTHEPSGSGAAESGTGPERHALLAAVASRAIAAIETTVDAPTAAAALIGRFSADTTARPALDLYQRLRDAEHLCRPCCPELARRLRRLGRLVERRGAA
jgi:hypothetical protein